MVVLLWRSEAGEKLGLGPALRLLVSILSSFFRF